MGKARRPANSPAPSRRSDRTFAIYVIAPAGTAQQPLGFTLTATDARAAPSITTPASTPLKEANDEHALETALPLHRLA
jgi:hypothetical protein